MGAVKLLLRKGKSLYEGKLKEKQESIKGKEKDDRETRVKGKHENKKEEEKVMTEKQD